MGTYKALENVKYGDNEAQRLHFYLPENVENAPLVVFIHGGGWRAGSLEQYAHTPKNQQRLALQQQLLSTDFSQEKRQTRL